MIFLPLLSLPFIYLRIPKQIAQVLLLISSQSCILSKTEFCLYRFVSCNLYFVDDCFERYLFKVEIVFIEQVEQSFLLRPPLFGGYLWQEGTLIDLAVVF